MSDSFPNLHEDDDDDDDHDENDDTRFVDSLLQRSPEREQSSPRHHSSPDTRNHSSADSLNEVAIEDLLSSPGSPVTNTTNTHTSNTQGSTTSLSLGSPSTITKSLGSPHTSISRGFSIGSTDNSKSTLDYSIDSNLLRSFSSNSGGDFHDLGSDGAGSEYNDEMHYSSLTLRVEDEGITDLPEDSGRPYVAQQYPSIAAPNVPNSNMSEWSDEDDETARENSDDEDALSLHAIPEAGEEEEDPVSTDDDDGGLINELSNRNSSSWEEGEPNNNSASTENDITLASSSDDEDMVKGTTGDGDDTDDDDGPLSTTIHIETSSHDEAGSEKAGHDRANVDGIATPASDQVDLDETVDDDQNDSSQILNYHASSWDDDDEKVDDLNLSTGIKTSEDGDLTSDFDTFANPSADATDDERYGHSRRSLDLSDASLEPPPPPQVELLSTSSNLSDSRKNVTDSEDAKSMDTGSEREIEQTQEEVKKNENGEEGAKEMESAAADESLDSESKSDLDKSHTVAKDDGDGYIANEEEEGKEATSSEDEWSEELENGTTTDDDINNSTEIFTDFNKVADISSRSDADNGGDDAESTSGDELKSELPDGAQMSAPPPSRDESVKLANSNSSSISLDSNSTATGSDYDASREGHLDAYGKNVEKSVIGMPTTILPKRSMDNSSDSASTFNPSPGVNSDDGVIILSEQDMIELSTDQLEQESGAKAQTAELDTNHAEEGEKLNNDSPVIDLQETGEDSTSLSNSDPALLAVSKASPVPAGHSSVPARAADFHGSWKNNSAQGTAMASDFRSPTIEKLQAAKKAATMKLRSGLNDLREHNKVELTSAAEEQNRLEAELASSLQVMSSQSKVIDLLRDQNLSSQDQLSTALSNVKLLMEEKLDLKRQLNQTEGALEESQKETKLAKEGKYIAQSADEKASKILSLEKELDDHVLKCGTLEDKLTQADLELDKMGIEMENLYEEIENLKETLVEYQSSKDQLDETIAQLEERERAIEDLTRLLGEKDLKILELGQNSGESTTETSENEDTETRIDEMRQRLAASLDEIDALKDELRQTKNQLHTSKMDLERQSKTTHDNTASGESTDAKNETDSLNEENAILNTRLNEELELANEQSQRILSLEKELEERLAEKRELEEKLSTAFTNLDEAKNEAEAREEQMNTINAEASLLRDKLEGLQMASAAALVQKDGSIASLQRSLTEFQIDEADNEELTKQLQQLKKELAEAKMALNEASETTANKINTLTEENTTLKDRVKTLQMETLAMLKSKDRSIAELQEKIDEYEDSEDEQNSTGEKLKEVQSELDIAKQRLRKVDKLETANDKLRRDLDAMKFETTTKLSGKDSTITTLRKTVREQSKKLTERDAEIARTKIEFQDAMSSKNKKLPQSDGDATKRMRTMEQENSRLRQQLQQLQQKTEKQMLMKDQTVQASQQEVREAKNALRDASQRIAVLWEENARLQRMANGK